MFQRARQPGTGSTSQAAVFDKPRQSEIFAYISRNDGPDDDRRAHPTLRKVDYGDLVPALAAAQERGRCTNVRPYHFQIVRGVWNDPEMVDEVLVKRVRAILHGRFGGDFLEFCASVQARDLLKPLDEEVNGRNYRISMLQPLGDKYGASPYRIAMRYLEIVGERERFRDLEPFHFSSASQGTYLDESATYTVIKRKIQSLLRDRYGNDFGKLWAGTNRAEFFEPFRDFVAGRPMIVSVGTAAAHFDQCLYTMLRAYVRAEGLEARFGNLRRYHLSTAAQGTYRDRKSVVEVLVKACKFQIANTYAGDEQAFLERATLPEIERPFYEEIEGTRFPVRTRTAVVCFGESSRRIKRLYLRHRDAIELSL